MQQNCINELLTLKREKFRVQIRNEKLKEEFQKKRKFFTLIDQKNEMLHQVNNELTKFSLKEILEEEDYQNIKLLLQVLLKAFEGDEMIDTQLTQNLVKNFKFFINVSDRDFELLELSINIIHCALFYLDKEDYSKFEILGSVELLQYIEKNIDKNLLEIIPQILGALTNLVFQKQIFRDFIIQDNFSFLKKLIQIDHFRQHSEGVLGLIQQACYHSLSINQKQLDIVKEYIMNSYFDENLGIRRLVLQILEELVNKLEDQLDTMFADEFLQSPVFYKLHAESLKQHYDLLPQSVLVAYFGLNSYFTEYEIPFYTMILNQNTNYTDARRKLRIAVYWAISNKIRNEDFLQALYESEILKSIFESYKYESINENLELSFIINNLTYISNQQQISKLIQMGLIIMCENLFNLQNQLLSQNILKSLIIILKKMQINQDQNNELIIPFKEIKSQIENTSLVEKVSSSNCSVELIQEFDVYF